MTPYPATLQTNHWYYANTAASNPYNWQNALKGATMRIWKKGTTTRPTMILDHWIARQISFLERFPSSVELFASITIVFWLLQFKVKFVHGSDRFKIIAFILIIILHWAKIALESSITRVEKGTSHNEFQFLDDGSRLLRSVRKECEWKRYHNYRCNAPVDCRRKLWWL